MAGRIQQKVIHGIAYYYYQESYRVKLDSSQTGKTRGSGKSQVRTRNVYLGTAEECLAAKKNIKKPVSAQHRSFGWVAASYQAARNIGLDNVLEKHIPGTRYGIARWKFFLLAILNRLDKPSSKNMIGEWMQKTVLPDVMRIDPRKITGKAFWYVTDDVISEKALKQHRQDQKGLADDLFVGLEDRVFIEMENELFAGLRPHLSTQGNSVIYDTTNFHTYFEPTTESLLAKNGHNKDSKHHLRQIGLTLATDQATGLPIHHRVYAGNRQDAHVFGGVVTELMQSIAGAYKQINDVVLLLDKGNNSKKNFDALAGTLHWVGSLVPSQHRDLLAVPVDQYSESFGEMKLMRIARKVMGRSCALVMTYDPKLARKQEHSLQNSIAKLLNQLQRKRDSYANPPKVLNSGIKSILEVSRYKKFVRVVESIDGLRFEVDETLLTEQRQRMGKNLIFTSRLDAESGWIVTQYKERGRIEDGFKTLKCPELISIRPIRHWTDSKIRAYIFCCIMSFLLLNWMQYRACQAKLVMSHQVLKRELSDLQEILWLYPDGQAERLITQRSSIQDELFQLFQLGEIERTINLHKPPL